MKHLIMAASDISLGELKANEIYLSVAMRMFTTETNLNGVRVTEGFIDDIIAHAEDYVCMPLCADTAKLRRGDVNGLTHMFDRKNGRFLAPQIGSFFEFAKEKNENGVSLLGTARINRRDEEVVEAIQKLYDAGKLNFSFEIRVAEATEENGEIVVDAAEGNRLTAMAVVSTPAYPSATALDIAAELDLDAYRQRLYRLAYEAFEDCWWEFLQIGVNYAILYLPETGKLMRMDVEVRDNEVIMTDMYEVQLVRAGEENDTNNGAEQTAGNVEEQVSETQVEEAQQETPDTEDVQIAEVTEGQEEGTHAEDSEVNDLRSQLEAAQAELENYRRAEEEARHREAVGQARAYAERVGLDTSDANIQTAVENCDYAALASAVMAKPAEEPKDDSSERVLSQMDMKPYGNMFEMN